MSTDSNNPKLPGYPIAFLPLGAIIQHFYVGPRNIDIVQGFDEEEHYKKYNAQFFGETIGRVANRISNGKINDLNGRSYQLAVNNPPNALHGGEKGWGKKTWDGPIYRGLKNIHLGLQEPVVGEQYTFCLVSEDGDEGYPGSVEMQVFYTTGTRKNALGKTVQVLDIEYEARLAEDSDIEETVVNITNHSYFNLSGKPTIEGTEIKLSTNAYLPVENGIPISTSTACYPNITAKKAFTLGPTEPDIDDCFIVSPWNPPSEPVLRETALSNPPIFKINTARTALRKIVKAYHPDTKIHLDILTTEPAFQFYTGKYIDVPEILDEDGKVVKEARGPRSGFCVEPSRFVNAVNVEEWRRQVVLKKGEKYGSRIVYEAWSEEEEGEPEAEKPERIMKGVVDGGLPEGSEVW